MSDTQKVIPMSPAKQSENPIGFYKMQLRFSLSIGFSRLNNMLEECGFSEKTIAKNAISMTMQQVVPFVPDPETIDIYKETIKENYNKDHPDMNIHDIKFEGYDYLYRVELDTLKRIVVLGGSFNPPTYAHKELLEHIMTILNAEKGIYVPSSDFYVKRKCERNHTPFTFSEQERLDMLNSMLSPNTEVSTCEYGDTTKGRTHTTLMEIQKQYPEYEIIFVMGSDKLGILPKWKLSNMLDQFKIAVIKRNDDDPDRLISGNPKLAVHHDSFFVLPELDDHGEVSSSEVQQKYRKSLTNPQVLFDMPDYVTKETDRIIRKHIASL